MPRTRSYWLALGLWLVSSMACDDNGVVEPFAVSGTYVLESVTGRGPAVGTLVLTANGEAVRRVRYSQAGGTLSPERVARGTFWIAGSGVVDLRLREDDGRSTHVWRPTATLAGSVFRIRHPDPADGPDIIESYRRQ